MRKILIITFLLVLFGGLAEAQVPTAGNVFFGYSYYNTDLSSIDRTGANGWEASVEGKMLPFIGMVVDFSDYYGSQSFLTNTCPGTCPTTFGANVEERNILFGPRVSAKVGKFRPFAEALVGIGHVNVNGFTTDNSFATALGGGLDYQLVRLVSWRFQGDYMQTQFFSTTQNGVRISTGIALHF